MNKLYNKRIGRIGENKAKNYLVRRGYKIIKRNYNVRGGEIDIIAEKDGCVCFVEVKTRTNNSFGTPAEAVTYIKQQCLLRAAKVYISKTGHDIECRFDVIEVFYCGTFIPSKINHLKNVITN